MAATQAIDRKIDPVRTPLVRVFDVDASVTIWQGTFVDLNLGNGFARPFAIGDLFLGVAIQTVINPLVTATTNKPLKVEFDHVIVIDQAIGNADVGKRVFITDDSLITLAVPGVNPDLSRMGPILERINGSSFSVHVTGPIDS